MTDRPRVFKPVEGDFEQNFRLYHDREVVPAFLRLVDWWLARKPEAQRSRSRASSTSAAPAQRDAAPLPSG